MTNSEDFVNAYIEAALWADTPEEAETGTDLAPESETALREMAGRFFDAHTDDILSYGPEQAGHDLWLTQNGHGCGYWEEDHGTPESCARLDAAAKALGPVGLYIGDDGQLYADLPVTP